MRVLYVATTGGKIYKLIDDGTAHVQAGAGIVADSVPRSEHDECVAKAAAVLRAVATASALRTATRRVRSPNVDFRLLHVPSQWPDGTFVSVHVVPETVPEHPAPVDCSTGVALLS